MVPAVESKRRIEELQKFAEEVMVKGVDYGLVDGFSRPSLLKPGAEKLCDVFGERKNSELSDAELSLLSEKKRLLSTKQKIAKYIDNLVSMIMEDPSSGHL